MHRSLELMFECMYEVSTMTAFRKYKNLFFKFIPYVNNKNLTQGCLYDPKRYQVVDKATQPDVIGYAVAATTEAIQVVS